MNDKLISFIICANNDFELKECLLYINNLHVPNEYSIETIVIKDAVSMCSGYNTGISQTDAKYKVYLHQDVYITNKDFVYDLLKIFTDKSVGMFGLVGSLNISETKGPCDGDQYRRTGKLYQDVIIGKALRDHGNISSDYEEVLVIDGLLMATQYDIPWREDLFDGWDFYDCSQSMEFLRNGYKVVVPRMDKPWALHNNDINNMDNYEHYWNIFKKEYGDEFIRWNHGFPVIEDKTVPMQITYPDSVTIIIIANNECEWAKLSVESVKNFCLVKNTEIILVDNCSTDGLRDWAGSQSGFTYVYMDEGVCKAGDILIQLCDYFDIQNDIFVMEAHNMIVPNTIERTMETLYSDEKIGMVAPVVNNGAIYQPLDASIDNFEKAYQFSLNNNGCSITKILGLDTGVFLIKKSILNMLSGIDNKLGSLESVAKHISLQMIKSGYDICVRKEAILWNMMTNQPISDFSRSYASSDNERFNNLWRLNNLSFEYDSALMRLMPYYGQKDFNVLEIGCGLGATLYEIGRKNPRAHLYGCDISRDKIDIASSVMNAIVYDIESDEVPFIDIKFDCIIFGNELSLMSDPQSVIQKTASMLNEGGYLIAGIKNSLHISIIEDILDENLAYKEEDLSAKSHGRIFTYDSINKMLSSAGFTIEEICSSSLPISDTQSQLIDLLLAQNSEAKRHMYEAFQYIFRAHKE